MSWSLRDLYRLSVRQRGCSQTRQWGFQTLEPIAAEYCCLVASAREGCSHVQSDDLTSISSHGVEKGC